MKVCFPGTQDLLASFTRIAMFAASAVDQGEVIAAPGTIVVETRDRLAFHRSGRVADERKCGGARKVVDNLRCGKVSCRRIQYIGPCEVHSPTHRLSRHVESDLRSALRGKIRMVVKVEIAEGSRENVGLGLVSAEGTLRAIHVMYMDIYITRKVQNI